MMAVRTTDITVFNIFNIWNQWLPHYRIDKPMDDVDAMW